MMLKWFKRTQSKNTSDNNISITTNSDIMFSIGQNLGEIKEIVKQNENRFNNIEETLKEHHKRIKKLEKSGNYTKKV